jgi:hypothetical protein
VREPGFNPLDILQRNGGCMPFRDFVRLVGEGSKIDKETAYNRAVNLVRNRVIIKIVLRRKKNRSKCLARFIPSYGSTWIARDKKSGRDFIDRMYQEAEARIRSDVVSPLPLQIGQRLRIVKSFCNGILLTQVGVRPWEMSSE